MCHLTETCYTKYLIGDFAYRLMHFGFESHPPHCLLVQNLPPSPLGIYVQLKLKNHWLRAVVINTGYTLSVLMITLRLILSFRWFCKPLKSKSWLVTDPTPVHFFLPSLSPWPPSLSTVFFLSPSFFSPFDLCSFFLSKFQKGESHTAIYIEN